MLGKEEIDALLALDVPAHLGTITRAGFPRVTPIWFLWSDGAFYMSSVVGGRHLQDLSRNARAFVCIDTESKSKSGVRHHRQLRARGLAELHPDKGGEWTRRITLKYERGLDAQAIADRRAAMKRTAVRLQPSWMRATAG